MRFSVKPLSFAADSIVPHTGSPQARHLIPICIIYPTESGTSRTRSSINVVRSIIRSPISHRSVYPRGNGQLSEGLNWHIPPQIQNKVSRRVPSLLTLIYRMPIDLQMPNSTGISTPIVEAERAHRHSVRQSIHHSHSQLSFHQNGDHIFLVSTETFFRSENILCTAESNGH
jgi:hypothetical protein